MWAAVEFRAYRLLFISLLICHNPSFPDQPMTSGPTGALTGDKRSEEGAQFGVRCSACSTVVA